MNKILEIATSESLMPMHSLSFVWVRLRELTRNRTLENLIPFESLPERYQISAAVLWDCLLALKLEPQKLEEQIYFTAEDLKRLEQFIKRIEISWACPHILETCYRAARKSSSSPRENLDKVGQASLV